MVQKETSASGQTAFDVSIPFSLKTADKNLKLALLYNSQNIAK